MGLDKELVSSLVIQLQNGDMKAFEKLYNLTNQKAYFVAKKITKHEQDAQDILQESYITVLSKISELTKPESFESWLNQIVANKAKDWLRKKNFSLFNSDEDEKNVVEFLPDDSFSYSPHENLDKKATQELVDGIIDELSEDNRLCVLLYYFDEMSVADIAESVGIPEGTVKSRLFNSRKEIETKVRALEKKGLKLYGAAPIPLVIWALKATGKYVGASFAKTSAAAAVLTGSTAAAGAGVATVAGTGAATTAATAVGASAATAGAGAVGAAAATGTGVIAKIAAFTVVQKVAAGIVVAGVVSGAAVGTTKIINNKQDAEDISQATTAVFQEITELNTYDYNNIYVENASDESSVIFITDNSTEYIPVIVQPVSSLSSTEPVTKVVEHTTAPHQINSTTAKVISTAPEKTTREKRTLKTGVTKVTTTRPVVRVTDPPKVETTTKVVVTTKPTTAKATTTVPTTKATATLNITVMDAYLNTVGSFSYNLDISSNNELTSSRLNSIVSSKGYTPSEGYEFGYSYEDDFLSPGGTYVVYVEEIPL